MLKTIGLPLRGRWLAGFLLAGGSILVPLTLQPPDNPPEPPRSIVLGSHSKPVRNLAFAPDGKTLASGGGWPHVPGEIKLWDLATTSERLAFADPHGSSIPWPLPRMGRPWRRRAWAKVTARLGEGLLRRSCAG
jgi:hypothetical protein